MAPEQWERVKDIVDGALALPPAERPGFIRKSAATDPEVIAEAESLLSADTAAPSASPAPAGLLGPGFTVEGRYLIERELGSGGFATTWLASDLILHGRQIVIK